MRAAAFIDTVVQLTVDRPMDSAHPEFGFRYPINYGYVPREVASDGEALDAYVLGIDRPVESFQGRCIAVIHRLNDDDDKLVVVPDGIQFSDEAIRQATFFQEQFFRSVIIRSKYSSSVG